MIWTETVLCLFPADRGENIDRGVATSRQEIELLPRSFPFSLSGLPGLQHGSIQLKSAVIFLVVVGAEPDWSVNFLIKHQHNTGLGGILSPHSLSLRPSRAVSDLFHPLSPDGIMFLPACLVSAGLHPKRERRPGESPRTGYYDHC